MMKTKVKKEKKKIKNEKGVLIEDELSLENSEVPECLTSSLIESMKLNDTSNMKPKTHESLDITYPKLDQICNEEEMPWICNIDDQSDINEEVLSMEPSAPIMVEDSSIYYNQCELSQNILEVHNEEVCRTTELIESIQEIKAYSLMQLLSLYDNFLLNDKELIISDFLDSQKNVGNCEFYEIVQSFLDARMSLIRVEKELCSYSDILKNLHKSAWTFEQKIECDEDVCLDRVIVKAKFKYETAHFQTHVAEKLTKYAKGIRTTIFDSHTLYIYQAKVQKVKATNFVQKIMLQCSPSHELPKYSPVSCSASSNHSHDEGFTDLKECISVLFSFCRRGIDDDVFNKDIKSMLCDTVALLLRFASYSDNFFILNHLLRCPTGVGDWGAHFIQVPSPACLSDQFMLGCPELDYTLTVLSIILCPIKQRENFLSCYKEDRNKLDSSDCDWVVIDCTNEGISMSEDDGLRLSENDIIQFINQIPFEGMFKHILNIEDNSETSNSLYMASPHSVIKLIAFSTCLLRIFELGLINYCKPEYKGVTKRLCRLVSHTVLYTTQYWREYQSKYSSLQAGKNIEEDALFQRIQVEYDEFMERIIKTIFDLRHISGVLETLCAMPYNNISNYKLSKVLCSLFTGYTEIISTNDDYRQLISNQDITERFYDFVAQLDEHSIYFFLTALSNMAVMRQSTDKDIIETITNNIFKVSFIKNDGKESINRVGREVLSNITNSHPYVISTLIDNLQENLPDIGSPALYFFKHLNLKSWIVTENDLISLSKWTLSAPSSLQNQLGRTILGKLNWGFSSDGKLFLSKDTHKKVLLSLVEAYMKVYNSQHIGSNLISSSVKQVTSVVYSSSQEQLFLKWCWQMAGNFRLHHMDQSPFVLQNLILQPYNFLRSVPDPLSCLDFCLLKVGLLSDEPFCIFAAHLMSTWGHSIPEFCINGPKSLDTLVTTGHYEAAITVLYLISPLFFSQHEEISTNVGFVKAIQSILAVDNKYSSIAIRYVSAGAPEKAWQLLSSLIITQMNEYKKYNLSSPGTIISFWVNILISLPNWANELSIINILNVICEYSVNDRQCWATLNNVFREELKVKAFQENKSSGLASIFNWVAIPYLSLPSSDNPNIVTKYSNPCHGWFALLALHCESKIQNSLWRKLLSVLEANPNLSLSSALTDVCNELGLRQINPNVLSIYRFGQQILDLPVEHPAFSVTVQGFLTLHLARVVPESRNRDPINVIHKCYESYINSNFLKKILQKYKEYMMYSVKKQVDSEQESASKSTMILEAMAYWLHDSKFYDAGLYLPSLSPKEEPIKLQLLLQGNWDIWQELLDYNDLQQSKDNLIKMWDSHRLLKEISSPTGSPSLNPLTQKLWVDLSTSKKLQEYDRPKAPPPLFPTTPSLQLNISLDLDNLLFDIDRVVDIFVERAINITLISKEICALDCVFLELMPTLWINQTMKTVVNVGCHPSRLSKIKKCTGPANIIIEYNGKHLNDDIKAKLEFNREKRTCVIKEATRGPTVAMTQSALKLEKIIQKVIISSRYEEGNGDNNSNALIEVGRKLFYYLLGKMSDETNFYPPAKQVLLDNINHLGQEFLSGHSDCQEELVSNILKSEYVCNSLLSSHFTPMISAVGSFLQLYEMSSSHAASQPEVTFILLSKFELETVLKKSLILVEGRGKLIQIITNTLTSLLAKDDGATQICSELYRVHLNMIFTYNFFDHFNEILTALLNMSLLIQNDNCKIVTNMWYDFINTLTKGIVVFHSDMNMTEVFCAIKSYVDGQNLLNESMVVNCLQCLAEYFYSKRVEFGLHGLYSQYKKYVTPIATLLGMISCIQGCGLGSTYQDLSRAWNKVENMFGPWICTMGRDMKESCPKWVQEFSHDKQLLLPWTANDTQEPQYMSAMFVGVIQFIYESTNDPILLSKLLDFYCRTYANKHTKDHILSVIHSSFTRVYWNHLSPSIRDMELIYRIMNEYLPECHSFIGNLFVQINWAKTEAYFCQQDEKILARFNILFLNILIRVAMEQSVRQKGNNLRDVIVAAEWFHWELLDHSSFENVINWVVMSCDPRIVLNSESRNPIDIAVINILHIAAGFSNHVKKHKECHLKRSLLVRALVRLLITCSKKHNILLVSRLTTFEQTFAILFNQLENTIIEVIPKNRQFSEAIDLIGEALIVIEGGASPSILEEVCRNALINWLQGQHTSDIFILPLMVTISRSVLQLQHRCALLEQSLKAFFKHQEGKEERDRLSWPDFISHMFFPASSPMAMFHYAAQQNHLLVIYSYCRWKLYVKGDADKSLLLSNLQEIFSIMKPDDSSERGFILIISLILNLISSQFEMTGSHKLGLWRSTESIASTLDMFAADSCSVGILSVFGFGTESRLPVRVRLLCRSLSSFLTCQLVQPGCFRSLNEPTLDDDSIPLQDNTAKAVIYLNAVKKNSLYTEFIPSIDWVENFLQNTGHSVLDGTLLLAGLVMLLYYNDATLKHLTFNVIGIQNNPVIEKLLKITHGVVKTA